MNRYEEYMSEFSNRRGAITESIVREMRRWFCENGKDCNAVIGISGGKDSTVTAALCVEALGKDRVIGVLLPRSKQSDIDDAYAVCNHLGIKHVKHNIWLINKLMLHAAKSELRKLNSSLTEQTRINLLPRIRMCMLYAISQSVNGRVINTSNFSEDYIGYSTIYGDSAGDYAPLKELTSDEVIEIGRSLNLPEWLLTKAPADGLCGKTDEDNLGFTYACLNRYIRTDEIDDREIKTKIGELHEKNKFKRNPIERFRFEPSVYIPFDPGKD